MNSCILISTNGDDLDLVQCLLNSITENYPSAPPIIVVSDTHIDLKGPCDIIVLPRIQSSKIVTYNSMWIHTDTFHNATILRFRAIDLLIKHCDKILYLDTDTIVLGDLSDLFAYDHSISAALDYDYSTGGISDPPLNSIYFNAGVLLVTKQLYDRCNIKSLYEDYESKPISLLFDQDYLNSLTPANIIDQKYNYVSFTDVPKDTKILHYCCIKPWVHPERFEYPPLCILLKYLPPYSEKYSTVQTRMEHLDLVNRLVKIGNFDN